MNGALGLELIDEKVDDFLDIIKGCANRKLESGNNFRIFATIPHLSYPSNKTVREICFEETKDEPFEHEKWKYLTDRGIYEKGVYTVEKGMTNA